MKKLPRQVRKNLVKEVKDKGEISKAKVDETVSHIKGAIIEAVKEVDLVALHYVLSEHEEISEELHNEIINRYIKTIEEFSDNPTKYSEAKERFI